MNKVNIFIKTLLHPLMYLGVKAIRPVKTDIISGKIVNGCIYAVNHTNGNDFPTAAQIVKHHFYILADFTMKKDIRVNILNRLNGVVYVDRKSRQSRAKAKDDLKNDLSEMEIPVNWILVDSLPRNAGGKVDKKALENIKNEAHHSC